MTTFRVPHFKQVTQGVGGQIAAFLEDVLDPIEGTLHNLDESYGDIINQIDDRIAAEEARLEAFRQRLVEKYARLEQLLADLQGTQVSLSSIIGSTEESS